MLPRLYCTSDTESEYDSDSSTENYYDFIVSDYSI